MAGDGISERDLANLGVYFQALGFPSRLHLLNLLQVPRTAQEIHLAPTRPDRTARGDRSVSRQALSGHLRKLLDIGLVEAAPGRRGGRTVTEYVVSHARLFALVEEMRRLALIRPPPGPAGVTVLHDEAGQRATGPAPSMTPSVGPEGRAYALAGPGPWTIGRLPTCEVCLPHDPFVSKRNSVLRAVRAAAGGPAWAVEARRDARNPTMLNWQPLEPGAVAPLRSGDVLRVGRTLLVMREG